MITAILLIALLGQARSSQVTLECKNCNFGEAPERRVYIEKGTLGHADSHLQVQSKRRAKKYVVRRRHKILLPKCTPNYGDPVPYRGTVTPFNITLEDKMPPYYVPIEKGIGIGVPKPEDDLLLRFPQAEVRPLEIKEGSIGKSLALTGIYLDGIVIPFNGWENNDKVKAGDYVLVPKEALHDLLKANEFIKLLKEK